MNEPLDWSGAAPRSPRFDDIYFSPADGLAEARVVFLQGCGLPDAWAGRRRFVVGELGFGTGLNILALIALWRQRRPAPDAVLHVFSVEAFPISRVDAARALAHWSELAAIAEPLLDQWPQGRRGFHRIEWPDDGVILDIAIDEAEAALSAWSGLADAWFLDGFAPSKNPGMWRAEVMALIAKRSGEGARAATFSVAGAVRRGLADAGFEIARAPGFGRKKERLEARLIAANPASPKNKGGGAVAVIGAGIAGAALARAFRRLGCAVSLFDAEGAGAGASGNPSALVTPRLDAGFGPGAAVHAEAFARAAQLYRRETPDAVIAEGALQLAVQPRDAARFDAISRWDGFDPESIAVLAQADAARALGEAEAAPALFMRDALVVEPAAVLAAWLAEPPGARRIDGLERDGAAWRLIDTDGEVAMTADIVCLAAGPASAAFMPGTPLRAVRGQANFTSSVTFTGTAAAFGGYALPTRTGVLFGATHDRDDWGTDLRPEDEARNLNALTQGRPALADRLDGATVSGRASLRAMAADHLPLAGPVPGQPGMFVLSGFGGRGFTLVPLLAEAVAAEALGAPNPLPRALAARVDPRRFEGR